VAPHATQAQPDERVGHRVPGVRRPIKVRRSHPLLGASARATVPSVCLPRARSAGGPGRARTAKFREAAAKEPARQSTSGPGGASSARSAILGVEVACWAVARSERPTRLGRLDELQAVIARVNQDIDRLRAERDELLAAFRRMADVIEQLRQSRGLGRDG
jgi:hypothetical protein